MCICDPIIYIDSTYIKFQKIQTLDSEAVSGA